MTEGDLMIIDATAQDGKLLAVSIEHGARMIGVSPHTLRGYVRAKVLRVTRLGRRICIPIDALEELVRNGAPRRTKLQTKQKTGRPGDVLD